MERKNDVDKLIEEYTGVIHAVARKKFPDLCRDDDLLQNGMIGLWRAAECWDGERPFLPFACACVANAMRNYVRELRRTPETEALEAWDGPSDPPQEETKYLFPEGTRERALAELLSAGWSKEDAARRLGVSARTVTRLCASIRNTIERQG